MAKARTRPEKKPQTTASLAPVIAALETGKLATALRGLLAVWATSRDARVTGWIEVLSKRLPEGRDPPKGKTVAALEAAWAVLAQKQDPAHLPVLLGSLGDVRRGDDLARRLELLAGRCDPRIAAALCDLVDRPNVAGDSGSAERALDLIVEIADPRAAERLAKTEERMVGSTSIRKQLVKQLPGARARLDAALKAHPVAAAGSTAELAAIDRLLGGTPPAQDLGALFAEVYKHPLDDGPRIVLGDALEQAGDPRGQLIGRQLAGNDDVTTRRLIKAHGRAWLGLIAEVVEATGLVYERGFVSGCRIAATGMTVAERLGDRPEWATVRDLDVGESFPHIYQRIIRAMPVLRSLRNAKEAVDHPTLEHLHMRAVLAPAIAPLVASKLPALRSLALDVYCEPDAMAKLFVSKLVRQLTAISLQVEAIDDGWQRAVAKLENVTMTDRS